MNYTETEGDLFTLGLPAIAHGCNSRGSMSGGIARQFRDRFPAMHTDYVQRCNEGRFVLGDIFRWDAGDFVIYNLATQIQPGAHARLDAINTSVRAALTDAAALGLDQLGVPRIGAGIGGLAWTDVCTILQQAGEQSSVELVAVTTPGRSARDVM